MNHNTLAAIADTKEFRKDLDEVLQRLKKAQVITAIGDIVPVESARSGEARQIATLKLMEAIIWLGYDLKAIHEEHNAETLKH